MKILTNKTISSFLSRLALDSIPMHEKVERIQIVVQFIDWLVDSDELSPGDAIRFRNELYKKKRELSHKQAPKLSLPLKYVGFSLGVLSLLLVVGGIYIRFFRNTNTPFAYSTAPVQAGRTISFQGRLTDSLGNPINAPIDITYNFYTVPTGGTPITGSTRVCTAGPDQDGVFSSLIGNDSGPSCNTELPHSIFTENTTVYLGVTVGTEPSEMTPRQQIANVGYAINSETLQGMPPGQSVSNVPFINQDGNMLIGASNPGIRSTYASSNFTISSAQATTIQSAGSGDITLSASEGGSLRFKAYNGTLEEVMTILNTGRVGIGITAPRALLDVNGDATVSGSLIAGGQIKVGEFTSPPTNLGNGSLYYDSNVNKVYFWNGTAWTDMAAGATQYFQRTLGSLAPTNITDDLNIGAVATGSAIVHLPGLTNNDAWFNLGTGKVGIGDTTPLSLFTVGNGDLFQVDSTGRIVALDGVAHTIDDVTGNLTLTSNSNTISLNDNVTFAGTTTLNSQAYTWPGTITNGHILQTNGTGTLSWVDPIGLVGGANLWSLTNGSLYPVNTTLDLFVGGTASNSAKFAFINANSGTPTASISGTTANVRTFVDGNGNISTTNRTSLVLGNSATYNSTGNILLNPNGTGNVGIGTTSPVSKLNLLKSIAFNLTSIESGQDNLFLNDTGGTQGADAYGSSIGFGRIGESSAERRAAIASVQLDSDPDRMGLAFLTHPSGTFGADVVEAMRIGLNGNIGISTTTPTAKLDVVGDASLSGHLVLRGTTPNYIHILNGTDFRMSTSPGGDAGNVDRLTMLSNGNVGLGTTSPTAKIDVRTASGNTGAGIKVGQYTVNGTSGQTLFPTGGTWYEYPGIVGVGNGITTLDIPSLDSYGTVGVVGVGGSSTGGRSNVGIYGHAYFDAAMGANSGNTLYGGKFTTRITSNTNDYKGTSYGLYSKADTTGGTSTAGSVYGLYSQALGQTNNTTYGGYFTGSGGTTNYGVYSNAGTNYFSANVGIGTTTPTTKLDVVGDASASGNITVGQNSALRSQYGPLNLAYKSGLNTWTTGMVLQDTTGYVGIGTTNPNRLLQVGSGTVSGNSTSGLIRTSTMNGSGSFRSWDFGTDQTISAYNFRIADVEGGITPLTIIYGTGNTGIGDTTPLSLFTVGNGDLFQVDSTGRIVALDGVAHTIDDVTGNLTLSSNSNTISLNDNVTFVGTTTLNSLAYTWPGTQSTGYILQTNGSGVLSWSDPSTLAGGTNLWDTSNGSLYPKNSTLDLFVGGTASASAKFAFLNVNSGTPTASVAGSLANVATYLTGDGNLATTNRQSLIIGNSAAHNTTGNTLINPNGIGHTIVGNTLPLGSDSFAGNSTLTLQSNAISSGRERLLYAKVSDSDNFFTIFNTTSADNTFIPTFLGYNNDNDRTGLIFHADVQDTSTKPALSFRATQIDTTSALTQRPLFGFGGGTSGNTAKMLIWYDGSVQIGDNVGQIDSPGNVKPTAKLDVVGNATISGDLMAGGQLQIGRFGYEPSAVGIGSLYFNTANNTPYYHNGTSWTAFSSGSVNYWNISNGAIYPINSTLDMFIGGTASASAKFAFLNVGGGTPTASVAGSLANVATYLTGNGNLSTTNMAALTVGSASTGSIQLSPKGTTGLFVDGSGNVGVGTTTPGGSLEVVSGNIFFGDTANANTTQGLTINQGGADNEIIALKSSDVSHGMTGRTESDTYGQIKKNDPASGGLYISGFKDPDGDPSKALYLSGIIGEVASTGKSSGSQAVVNIDAGEYTGSVQPVGADGNLVSFTNDGTTRLIIDAEGTIHQIPGSDIDIDLLTVQVTDTPTLSWDESQDQFNFSKGANFSGNVGIGNLSSTYKLDVTGDINLTGALRANGSAGTTGYILTSAGGGVNTWTDPLTLGGGSNLWTINNGALYPVNATVDAFIGGTASASAKFAFLNVNSGTPIASISGTAANVNTFIDGNGNISTTNRASLVLGNSGTYNSTGNILLNPNGTGNVGIGTTAPGTYKLNVNGSAYVAGATNTWAITGGQTDSYGISFWGKDTAGRQVIGANVVGDADWRYLVAADGKTSWGDGTLSFDTNLYRGAANVLQTDDGLNIAGNVGIGNTSPTEKLSVTGNATISGTLTLGNGSTLRSAYGPLNLAYKSGLNAWATGLSLQDSTGNVGIGTTSPKAKLHVAGAPIFGTTRFGIYGTAGVSRWTKFATIPITGAYSNPQAEFLIQSRYGSVILFAEVASGATYNTVSVEQFYISNNWNNGISASNFKIGRVDTGSQLNYDIWVATDTWSDLTFQTRKYSNYNGSGPNIVYYTDTYSTSDGADDPVATGYDAVIAANESWNNVGNVTFGDASGDTVTNNAGTWTLANDTNFVLSGGVNGLSIDTNTFSIDATNDRVGIGNVSPTYKLDVTGDINFTGALRANGSAGTTGYILTSAGGGVNTWTDPASLITGGESLWTILNGALYPTNATVDAFIGGTASASAKFAFLNVNSGTPTASISGTTANVRTFIDGNGNIGTTNRTSLVLGNSVTSNSTGNILLNPNGVGNVGIGTTTPTNKFQVALTSNQMVQLGSAGVASGVSFTNGSILSQASQFQISGAGSSPISFYTGGTFNTMTAGTERVRIDTSGNMGIATTSPLAALDVRKTSGTTPVASISGATSKSTLVVDQSGVGDIMTASSSGQTRFVVKNNGNVGIGYTNPTYKLAVNGSILGDILYDTTNPSYYVDPSGDSVFGGGLSLVGGFTASSASVSGSLTMGYGGQLKSAYGPLNLAYKSGLDSWTTGLILQDTTGNVGIGTVAPVADLHVFSATNAQMRLETGANANATFNIFEDGGASDHGAALSLDGTNNVVSWQSVLAGVGTDVLSIPYAGSYANRIGINTTTPLASLDLRSMLGTIPVASISGNTSQAALIVDQSGVGDIFTASSSGETRFVIKSNGNVGIGVADPTGKLSIAGTSSTISNLSGDIVLDSASGNISFSNDNLINVANIASIGQIQIGGFASPPTSIGNGAMYYDTTNNKVFYWDGTIWSEMGSKYWQRTLGSLSPQYITDALNLGAIASGSALVHLPGTNNQDAWFNLGTGTVGIGTTTPDPGGYGYKLDVSGTIVADKYVDSASNSYYVDPAGDSVLGGNVTLGDIFMIDGTPLISSLNAGSYSTITIKGSGDTTTASLCVDEGTGTACDGKINAGTIDPPYTINGKKYATYLPSMTGVKEETTGKVILTERNEEAKAYIKRIALGNQPEDSDLWLFAKASNLKDQIREMTVLLSSNTNGKIWYSVDPATMVLTFYSSTPGEISYRLTAPRFDAGRWANTRHENDFGTGFILNDRGSILAGDAPTYTAPKIVSQGSVFTIIGNFIEEFTAANQALFANITAGIITTQKIVSPLAEIDTLNVNNKIQSKEINTELLKASNSIETPRLNTNVIDIGTQSGQLAKLVINGLYNNPVVTIDAEGSATFAGTLTAEAVQTENASISGTLIAKEIQSETIDALSTQLASNSSTLASSYQTLSGDINAVQQELAALKTSPLPNASYYQNLDATYNSLSITDTANIYKAYISDSLVVGSLFMEDHSILALASDLSISSLGTITFFDGSVVMAKNGNITSKGEVTAASLAIKNEAGITVAEIDASGSARFNEVVAKKFTLESIATQGALIADSGIVNNINVPIPAIKTNAEVAGTGAVPQDVKEVIIYNDNVTEDSLIYLTPTSDNTQGQLSVSKKVTCAQNSTLPCTPYFIVSSSLLIHAETPFNWLIIN